MTCNELILLDNAFEEWREGLDGSIDDDKAFERFACTHVLRDLDLNEDEIESGIIGGSNDAAIDGVYVFLGDSLLAEDSGELGDEHSAKKIARDTPLVLHIIQAKRTPSFSETAIDKVANSTQRLLNLEESESDLSRLYSFGVLSRVSLFRRALTKFASRYLKVAVRFYYVTRGDTDSVNTKVEIKSKLLEQQFSSVIVGAEGSSSLVGARELWGFLSVQPSDTLQLTFAESMTSGTSYVALVNLSDYMRFLTDEEGKLRRSIFDWNVRDYQGEVEVNREIRESLLEGELPEFWWLNNGVTIVCSRSSIISKTFSLDDVQVVNGLQTSQTIFHALRDLGPDHPAMRRKLLVRILETGNDAETRDQVIRATNRQTSVPSASLRATDGVQRQIETYFLSQDWYYDRRKNYYRNQMKPVARIVSIPFLAQAVMAMGLSRPDSSRARPSSLLKNDADYKRVFNDSLPLSIYLWLAKTQRGIDTFLLTAVSGSERTNLRFHLAMLVVAVLHGGQVFSPLQLQTLADQDAEIGGDLLEKCLKQLQLRMGEFAGETGDPLDKVAKGREFVNILTNEVIPEMSCYDEGLSYTAVDAHAQSIEQSATAGDGEFHREIYHIKKLGADAKAVRTREGFRVLAGSVIRVEMVPSCPYSVKLARRKFRDSISDEGTLIQDIQFDSPSGAASFVLGASMSGFAEWKSGDGEPLRREG